MTKKIELVIDHKEGTKNTFHHPTFLKCSIVREGVKLCNEMNNTDYVDVNMIDKLCKFVADRLYDEQFTADELLDGIDAREVIPTLAGELSSIFGDVQGSGKPTKEKKA